MKVFGVVAAVLAGAALGTLWYWSHETDLDPHVASPHQTPRCIP